MSTTPHSKTEKLSQTIWNNKLITIEKNGISASLASSRNKANFKLFRRARKLLPAFPFLAHLIHAKLQLLQYRGLTSSIPQSWKKLLHVNSGDSTTPQPPICTITCRMLYDKLLTLGNLPPPTSEKKLLSYSHVGAKPPP